MTTFKQLVPAQGEWCWGITVCVCGGGGGGDGLFSFSSPWVYLINVPCFFKVAAVSCPAVPRSYSLDLCSVWCDHALGILCPSAGPLRLSSHPPASVCLSWFLQPPVNSFYAVLIEDGQPGGRGSPRKVGAALLVWGLGGHGRYRQLFLQLTGVSRAQNPPFGQLYIAPAVWLLQICQDQSQCFASIRASRVSKLTELS